MGGEEVGQKGTIEDVDRRRSARNIGAAEAIVFRQQALGAEIETVATRHDGEFANRRRIAQTEIKPLGADWRNHMGRLADEGDACGAKSFGSFHRERKDAAPGFDRHLAHDRMGAALDGFRQDVGRERGEALGFRRFDHAHEAGAVARQRHDRERSALGVELGRYVAMGALVGKVERQRRLRIGEAVGGDVGRVAAERVSPVGTYRQLRRDGAALQLDGDRILEDPHCLRGRIDARKVRERAGACLEGGNEVAVLDVVAEGVEVDFARRK